MTDLRLYKKSVTNGKVEFNTLAFRVRHGEPKLRPGKLGYALNHPIFFVLAAVCIVFPK